MPDVKISLYIHIKAIKEKVMANNKINHPAAGRYIENCSNNMEEKKISSFCMVIFGGSGDLSRRKLLPTLYHLYHEDKLPAKFSIIGFGKADKLEDGDYSNFVKKSIEEFSDKSVKEDSCDEFISHFSYVGGIFEDDSCYEELFDKISAYIKSNKLVRGNVIFYFAVPPGLFTVITEKIGRHNLNHPDLNAKVIIEKPFGRDQLTAEKLNRSLMGIFSENQIYRIDHYLGKETVQNIIFFRFSNSIFEPLWNRRYIDSVRITVAEDLGIGGRGKFYEEAGVVRDIVQNHIMQLIALVAMEPPAGFDADLIRDEKVKTFRSMRLMTEDDIIRNTVFGQYQKGKIRGRDVKSYREEDKVKTGSNTPTYFAAKMFIDNWRWAGVPFYFRTGKRLKSRLTEIVIQFKQPPLQLFGRSCDVLEPGYMVLTIQPAEAITLKFGVKYPNDARRIEQIKMNFSYDKAFHQKSYPAYSRLLLDCIKGDLTLFVRQDGIEAMWKIVDPVLRFHENTEKSKIHFYNAGTWGPEASEKLLSKDGRSWITGGEQD